MSLRKVNPSVIVIDCPDPRRHGRNIDLDWNTAAAIDLAGRNVLEAVQTSVDPKVIDCPDPRRHGRNSLDGVAKDGNSRPGPG